MRVPVFQLTYFCVLYGQAQAGLQHEQVLPGHACGARMDEQTHAV